MKLKEIIPIWLDYKQHYIKRSSMSIYISRLEDHITPEFGECESLDEHIVQDYILKKLKAGLSQGTIKDTLILLKTIMKYAAKRKLMEFIPWDLEYPKENKQDTMEVFSINDHRKLIEYVKANMSFRNLGIMITLSTGLRIGEVCGLTWNDIDIEKCILTVNKTIQRIYIREPGKERHTELIIDTPKTKSSQRQIPLSKDLLSILKPLKKVLNKDFFILSNDPKPVDPRCYRVYYGKLLKQLDMPVLKFHGMRHTFATRCVNAKIDIKTVSVILGHADIGTTLNTYAHPNLEQKKSAMDQLFKALK